MKRKPTYNHRTLENALKQRSCAWLVDMTKQIMVNFVKPNIT